MTIISHLRSYQALELAIRLGSLTNAAEELGITPAAVGQRIKLLEDYLGIELIVRGRSGTRATGELEGALSHLAKAFSELGIAAELLDIQRVNEVHVAANPDWAELWLKPRLPKFRKIYPNILFSINGKGDAPVRLGRVDVEVEFGTCSEDTNVDELFRDYLCPVGSLEITRRIRGMERIDDLEGFPLLHLDFYSEDPSAIGWPEWIEAYGHRKSAFSRGIRYQRIAYGLQAASSSAGFLICGLALIADSIERSELSLPFSIDKGAWTSHAFYARYRNDATSRKQIQIFREWLGDESRKTQIRLDRLINLGNKSI